MTYEQLETLGIDIAESILLAVEGENREPIPTEGFDTEGVPIKKATYYRCVPHVARFKGNNDYTVTVKFSGVKVPEVLHLADEIDTHLRRCCNYVPDWDGPPEACPKDMPIGDSEAREKFLAEFRALKNAQCVGSVFVIN